MIFLWSTMMAEARGLTPRMASSLTVWHSSQAWAPYSMVVSRLVNFVHGGWLAREWTFLDTVFQSPEGTCRASNDQPQKCRASVPLCSIDQVQVRGWGQGLDSPSQWTEEQLLIKQIQYVCEKGNPRISLCMQGPVCGARFAVWL